MRATVIHVYTIPPERELSSAWSAIFPSRPAMPTSLALSTYRQYDNLYGTQHVLLVRFLNVMACAREYSSLSNNYYII